MSSFSIYNNIYTLYPYPVAITGPVQITGPVEITGTFNISTSVSLTGPLAITGPVGITGPISITGPNGIIGGTSYSNLQGTDLVLGKFMYTDCSDKDAFYRLRVSEPYTLYEGSTINDQSIYYFDNDLNPTGSPSIVSITGPTGAYMTLTVGSGATGTNYAARQSHFYCSYQPGKSLLAYISAYLGTAVPGITRRIGFYDVDNSNNNLPNNGILLEQTINGLEWKVYQGPPENIIQSTLQSSWNIDKLDGNGPSGLTLDITKNILAFIDLEWLGVGRVRTGFFFNGVPIVCNVFNNTTFTSPYINSPSLPIRYEIRKTDNSIATADMRTICCTVISEGGYNPIGVSRSFKSQTLTLNGTEIKSCISIRLKLNYSRNVIIPESVQMITNLGGSSFISFYSIYLWRPSSSSVVTATWNSIDANSKVEYTNTELYSQMIADTSGINILLSQGSVSSTDKTGFTLSPVSLANAQSNIIRDNRDILLVVADNNNNGNNKTYTAILTFKEN
jgi:hypothetical protein